MFQEVGRTDQNVSDLLGSEQIDPLAEQVLVLVVAACMDQLWWAEEFLEAGSRGPEKLALKRVQTEEKNHSVVALPGVDGQKSPLLQDGE